MGKLTGNESVGACRLMRLGRGGMAAVLESTRCNSAPGARMSYLVYAPELIPIFVRSKTLHGHHPTSSHRTFIVRVALAAPLGPSAESCCVLTGRVRRRARIDQSGGTPHQQRRALLHKQPLYVT